MDAKTLFNLVKPHLDTMEFGEKKSFAQLIRKRKDIGRRRKILSVSRAKEKLRIFCSREMAKERA